MNPWEAIYLQESRSSVNNTEPSAALLWCLSSWKSLTGSDQPETAVDVGCGAGQHTTYLASLGIRVTAFDSSIMAMVTTQKAVNRYSLSATPLLYDHDIVNGLPTDDNSVDLVADISVYNYLLSSKIRHSYRQEIRRSIKNQGRLLLSLMCRDGGEPNWFNKAQTQAKNPKIVWDQSVNTESLLFSLLELEEELSDCFTLEKVWMGKQQESQKQASFSSYLVTTVWKQL